MSRAVLRLTVFVCLYSCVASCFNKKHVPQPPPTDPDSSGWQGPSGGYTTPYVPTTTTEQSLQISCPADLTGFCLNGGTCQYIVKDLAHLSDGTSICLCAKGYTGYRCKYHVIVGAISQPMSVEKTAGLAVGGVLLFIIIAVVLIVVFIRQRRKRAAADSSHVLRSIEVKEQPFRSKDFMRNDNPSIPLDTAGKNPPPAGFAL